MIEGKIWGTTRQLIAKETFSLHRLEVKTGGYCSRHFHRSKSNHFYVESGVLIIKVWARDKPVNTYDETVLRPGDEMTVEPMTEHQFEAVSNCVLYETYWVTLAEDIERRTQGGVKGAKGV